MKIALLSPVSCIVVSVAQATDSLIESEIRTMSGGRTSLDELKNGR